MKGSFGKHSGGITPKDQSSHGKAKGQAEQVTPPQKKGPPHVDGVTNLPKGNEHGRTTSNN